jgi:hypothetical protein
MNTEDRMAKLESDISGLKSDVKSLNALVSESIIANAKGFGSLRAEMQKGFETFRADSERGFGSPETAIKSLKLWMLATTAGSVILMSFVSFFGRALKLF